MSHARSHWRDLLHGAGIAEAAERLGLRWCEAYVVRSAWLGGLANLRRNLDFLCFCGRFGPCGPHRHAGRVGLKQLLDALVVSHLTVCAQNTLRAVNPTDFVVRKKLRVQVCLTAKRMPQNVTRTPGDSEQTCAWDQTPCEARASSSMVSQARKWIRRLFGRRARRPERI